MAESKSDYFSFDFSAYSEKISKFELLLLSRLALDSECGSHRSAIQLFLVRQRCPPSRSLLGVKQAWVGAPQCLLLTQSGHPAMARMLGFA
jgi:hypothetical protein